MPVYIYWGEEEFHLENAVKELRKKVLDSAFVSINHKILNKPDLKELIEAIQTLPMMFGNLLVEVNAENLFLRGKRTASTSDELMQKLCGIIENLDKRIHLLFICQVERDSGKKIDSVIKLTKTIQKTGEIREFPAFKFYQDDKVAEWIIRQAEQKSLKIKRDVALELLRNTGSELRKIDTELEKIKTAIFPGTSVGMNEVKEILSTNENVFVFADCWLKENTTDAILELAKLMEKNHPVKIMATLQTVTKRWLKIKLESKTKKPPDIARIVNLPPFVVEQDVKKLKNIPEERIFSMRERLKNTEYKVKSGELPPETALELLILRNS